VHSPLSVRHDVGEMMEVGNEDLGTFPGPKNVCVTSMPNPSFSRNEVIQNRATVTRNIEPQYKRPRSVLVKPTSIKNEPIGIRHHFDKRSGDRVVTNDKIRKTDDHGNRSKNVISKTKVSRPKESNLKTSLDEPGPANQTFSNNEMDPSIMRANYDHDPPKIRLPQAKVIRNDNPEIQYQAVQGKDQILFF
jgi:hypothetical protein